MHLVQVRGVNPRVPMTTYGTVPLVVRDYQNEIWFFAKGWIGCVKRKNRACKDQANGE